MELSVRLNFFPNSKYHCFELLNNSTLFYYFRCFLKIWLLLYNYLYNYIFPSLYNNSNNNNNNSKFSKKGEFVLCRVCADAFWLILI